MEIRSIGIDLGQMALHLARFQQISEDGLGGRSKLKKL